MVNHHYFCGVDTDLGPFFLKFCSYFPYTAKLCINGHEYYERQLDKRKIATKRCTTGASPAANRRRPRPSAMASRGTRSKRWPAKWLRISPHPFSRKDRQAGYRYEVSILQAEFALTQVLDRSLSGRVFFEDVIRQNLDLGRPDHVGLILDRRVSRRTRRWCGRCQVGGNSMRPPHR